jgi:hypothetical protein
MSTKICTKCKTEKPLEEFHVAKRYKDSRAQKCKECRKKQDAERYLNNKDVINEKNNKRQKKNIDHSREIKRRHYHKKKEQYKIYREINSEKISQKRKEYRDANKEKIKEQKKQYRLANADKIREKKKAESKKYYPIRKDKIIAYHNIRNKYRKDTDPVFKLKCSLRTRLSNVFKRMTFRKNQPTEQLLGCDFETAKNHLQNQFTDGMTWDNYGQWHIDHKIPFAIATTEEEVRLLCHYTN